MNMTDFSGSSSNSEALWLVEENGWNPSRQNIRESQFALGNGYLGVRGVLEETPAGSRPGTYCAGVFDRKTAQVADLVNFPNPVPFTFFTDGEKIGLTTMTADEHHRTLDLKRAVLSRRTLFRDRNGRRYDFRSHRFLSMHNKNIGVVQVELTPMDAGCSIDVHSGIDTSVANAGGSNEGWKKHFLLRETTRDKKTTNLVMDTMEKKRTVIMLSSVSHQTGKRRVFPSDDIFTLLLEKGQEVVLTKVFYVRHMPHSRTYSRELRQALQTFHRVLKKTFADLLADHVRQWQKLWAMTDVAITGDDETQRCLRFNIYHMLICGLDDGGFSSIGAKSLSGEGYRGHVFWDTEIFILPFFLFTFPGIAKSMLEYRYERLDAARELARLEQYQGAKFPWESADTGDEETPEWWRHPDGKVTGIYTQQYEHHITADIAYALHQYISATGDTPFLRDCGYEIIFETARFWASRVHYNRKKDTYEIKHVIGPDEYHEDVNNNAYTNYLALWNLVTAAGYFSIMKQQRSQGKQMCNMLALMEDEVKQWEQIATGMKFTITPEGVIEQFDGYSDLEDVVLDEWGENGLPLIPEHVRHKDLQQTTLLKQADVVMMLYLLDEWFERDKKEVNYRFYRKRTVHHSSLSPSISAIVASEIGDIHEAYRLFSSAVRMDIDDVNGNTGDGIHAASLGGTWQAAVFGFGGVRMRYGQLWLDPHLPETWTKMMFTLAWKGREITFKITDDAISARIAPSGGTGEEIIGIYGTLQTIKPDKWYSFNKEEET